MKKVLAATIGFLVLGLFVFAAAGCGGSSGNSGYNAPSGGGSSSGGSTGGGSSSGGGGTPAASANVTIANFAFDPASVTVKTGGKVTWKNNDSAPHQVSADDGQFAGPVIKPGGSWSTTMSKAGTFQYFCVIHKNMRGAIVVK